MNVSSVLSTVFYYYSSVHHDVASLQLSGPTVVVVAQRHHRGINSENYYHSSLVEWSAFFINSPEHPSPIKTQPLGLVE